MEFYLSSKSLKQVKESGVEEDFKLRIFDNTINCSTFVALFISKKISQNYRNDPTIREWIVKGLPNDTHSIDNALIIANSDNSFPLLIDPQLSGTKWLCSFQGEKLVVLRFDQPDFLQILKTCISFGSSVLIENAGLKLDPLIDPILSREISSIKKNFEKVNFFSFF